MKTLKSKILAVLAVLAITGAAFGIGAGVRLVADGASAAPTLYNQETTIGIYESASPAVVKIDVTQTVNSNFGRSIQEGTGSGFLIDAQGHIVTNNHVVAGATTVKVVLKNGNTVDGTVLGTDPIHDLAVVSVAPSAAAGITPLQLGDSSLVKPGQMAIAIGNPLGYTSSITVGVISGLNRNLSSNLRGLLQTDAAINPGNSGGPLLDVNGMVIGINTAAETVASGADGIGFAVPSNTVASALPDLIAGKKITRPWLGISGTALTQANASQLGLSVNQGVYVVTVVAGSPAEKAGLKAGGANADGTLAAGGDVITAVGGTAVKTVEELSAYLNTKKVGDTVNLTVLRNGQSVTVPATLAAWPESTPEATPRLPSPTPRPNIPRPWGGRGQGNNNDND